MEEDLKILEEMIENANVEDADMNNCFGGEHIEAIENLIKAYKELKEKLDETFIEEDYTSVYLKGVYDERDKWKSLVEEKIEELKQRAISYGQFIDKDESFNIQSKISVLQELLEKKK